jgi:hypothetical protein
MKSFHCTVEVLTGCDAVASELGDTSSSGMKIHNAMYAMNPNEMTERETKSAR